MTPQRIVQFRVTLTVIALYGMALMFLALRMSFPYDGTRVWLQSPDSKPDTVAFTLLSTESSPLRARDLIISVNSQRVTSWLDKGLFDMDGLQDWSFGTRLIYTIMRRGQTLEIPIVLTEYPLSRLISDNLISIVFMILLQVAGTTIYARKPDVRATQVLLLAAAGLINFTICVFLGIDVISFIGARSVWIYYRAATFVTLMLVCSSLLHFGVMLPRLSTNYAIKRHWLWLIYGGPYPIYIVFIALVYSPNTLEWLRRWELGFTPLVFIYFIGTLIAIVTGYRQLSSALERKQVETVALAFMLGAFLAMALGWVPLWSIGRPSLGWSTLPMLSLPIVVGIGIAVIRYELFDVNVVIQRTLIWSALTAMVISVYLVVVGVLSIFSQTQSNPLVSLVGAGVAALLFHPVQMRLQQSVNVLVYGERDTPYRVIQRLTNQLETALAPHDALELMVRTIAEALKLSYVSLELCHDGEYVSAAEYGTRDTIGEHEWVIFPVREREEIIGRFVVAPRESGDMLTASDRRLISGIVHHANVTIQAARLAAELQRSRERLVAARDEERKRLRRELHDGLGPSLASLTLQIDAVRNFLTRDPQRADTMLSELKTQVQSAVSDIRRLVYELRPPALDELGLVATLREKARQFEQANALTITFDAPALPALPAAVESAIYRITVEALANIARHAQATQCRIRLTCNSHICVEVTDNGRGIAENGKRGVGIHAMQERATELGGTCVIENLPQGGVKVIACLPIPKEQQMLSNRERN